MAPEVLRMEPFDEKSDVYSMGLLVWSLLTRKEPFEEFHALEPFFKAVCERNQRPPIPSGTLPRLARLIEAMWAPLASDRPSFTKVIKQMHHILVETAVSDPDAQEFWKCFCLERVQIYWADFVDCFLNEFVYLPQEGATMEQINAATDLQLSEFSSRSTPNASVVSGVFKQRYGNPNAPDTVSEDEKELIVSVKCARALLHHLIGGEEMIDLERFGSILGWFGPLKDKDGKSRFFERVSG